MPAAAAVAVPAAPAAPGGHHPATRVHGRGGHRHQPGDLLVDRHRHALAVGVRLAHPLVLVGGDGGLARDGHALVVRVRLGGRLPLVAGHVLLGGHRHALRLGVVEALGGPLGLVRRHGLLARDGHALVVRVRLGGRLPLVAGHRLLLGPHLGPVAGDHLGGHRRGGAATHVHAGAAAGGHVPAAAPDRHRRGATPALAEPPAERLAVGGSAQHRRHRPENRHDQPPLHDANLSEEDRPTVAPAIQRRVCPTGSKLASAASCPACLSVSESKVSHTNRLRQPPTRQSRQNFPIDPGGCAGSLVQGGNRLASCL